MALPLFVTSLSSITVPGVFPVKSLGSKFRAPRVCCTSPQAGPELNAQVAPIHIAFPGRANPLSCRQPMESGHSQIMQAGQNRIAFGVKSLAQVIHIQGQTSAEPGNIPSLKIDMEVAGVGQLPAARG